MTEPVVIDTTGLRRWRTNVSEEDYGLGYGESRDAFGRDHSPFVLRLGDREILVGRIKTNACRKGGLECMVAGGDSHTEYPGLSCFNLPMCREGFFVELTEKTLPIWAAARLEAGEPDD